MAETNPNLDKIAGEYYRMISKFIIKYRYTPKALLSVSVNGVLPYVDIVESTREDVRQARKILDELDKLRKKKQQEGKEPVTKIKKSPILGN